MTIGSLTQLLKGQGRSGTLQDGMNTTVGIITIR
ncbi:hypothetical protein FVEG_16219 [Fusarium verticillioides 7600]|uniref:Uncharacterized protein n=1 Tax=Gibberella moniliformis (strain M3125 / FGSC 7600) TaxID=334819 RepID=W7MK48_GIBM7|nr:hypothetical protein FVEG_16219 [Fusarium verticillioides 7600]EWG47955.1 hypothetical protein FVEG_16219 [Fusarium verticillioides 7600]